MAWRVGPFHEALPGARGAGIYVSDHPLRPYEYDALSKERDYSIAQIEESDEVMNPATGTHDHAATRCPKTGPFRLAGMVTAVSKKTTQER
jgi:DNA polymerase-3 subunit alpha